MHGRARGSVAAHAVLQVAAVAGEPGGGDLGVVQQELDARVAEAVRREQLELVGELERELVAAHDRVDPAPPVEVVLAESRRGLRDEGLAEGGDGAASRRSPQAARCPP